MNLPGRKRGKWVLIQRRIYETLYLFLRQFADCLPRGLLLWISRLLLLEVWKFSPSITDNNLKMSVASFASSLSPLQYVWNFLYDICSLRKLLRRLDVVDKCLSCRIVEFTFDFRYADRSATKMRMLKLLKILSGSLPISRGAKSITVAGYLQRETYWHF